MPTNAFAPSLRWAAVLLVVGSILALAVLPPFVGPDASAFIRLAFAPLCHQLPDRSFHLHGDTLALCQRCTGMLVGFFIGLLVTPTLSKTLLDRLARTHPPKVMALASVPVIIDWSLGALAIWANTPLSRSATGMLLGLAAGAFLSLALLQAVATQGPSSITAAKTAANTVAQ